MHLPRFVKSLLCSRKPIDNTDTYTSDRKDGANVHIKSVGSSLTGSSVDVSTSSPKLVVMGMGCSWPANTIEPKDLEEYAAKVYDLEKAPAVQKMLAINRQTGIKTRSIMWDNDTEMMWNKDRAPDIKELDDYFRATAVPLAVESCKKALKEWGGSLNDITHVVAVTATNAGNPGYDQLVAKSLGLRADTDRTLIHGVGCSGGLAALRCAANIASGASARGNAARVLVFATELCSINIRCDLDHAARTGETRIGPTLFSDGSSALVLCNEMANETIGRGIYSLVDYKTWIVPDTAHEMNFLVDPHGYKVHLSKNVAGLAAGSIKPKFNELMSTRLSRAAMTPGATTDTVDWALHPGGISILKGAQKLVGMSDEQLRASYDVYASRGNSSSVAVLAVLDRMREMGPGKDDVVACTFGPGMTVEMATLKRCRH
jgi:type III polyketide synthase